METNQTYQNELGSAMLPFDMRELVDTVMKRKTLPLDTIYPIEEAKKSYHILDTPDIENSLGVYLAQLGLSQARIAETEKYAHVTYFFDGGKEYKLDKCDRYLVPSPKVATYDLKPEMSCKEVTKKCLECLDKDYDFILVNFANPDMVGHTDRKSTRLNSSHLNEYRMPSSA